MTVCVTVLLWHKVKRSEAHSLTPAAWARPSSSSRSRSSRICFLSSSAFCFSLSAACSFFHFSSCLSNLAGCQAARAHTFQRQPRILTSCGALRRRPLLDSRAAEALACNICLATVRTHFSCSESSARLLPWPQQVPKVTFLLYYSQDSLHQHTYANCGRSLEESLRCMSAFMLGTRQCRVIDGHTQ